MKSTQRIRPPGPQAAAVFLCRRYGVRLDAGFCLKSRPYCHNDHYWQVYFDGNRTIREALAAAKFPAPMPAQLVMIQNPQS